MIQNSHNLNHIKSIKCYSRRIHTIITKHKKYKNILFLGRRENPNLFLYVNKHVLKCGLSLTQIKQHIQIQLLIVMNNCTTMNLTLFGDKAFFLHIINKSYAFVHNYNIYFQYIFVYVFIISVLYFFYHSTHNASIMKNNRKLKTT